MANENNLLLNLPFDEPAGATTAYDYGPKRYDAEITNATFTTGRNGNCIHFEGEGSADINGSVLNLTGDWTITAWIKPNALADGVSGKNRLGFFFNTAALDGSRAQWLDVMPDKWGYYAIRKTGSDIAIFADGVHVKSVALPGSLTGLAVLQDVYCFELAHADIDDLHIYGIALTNDEIAESLSEVTTLEYFIDGQNFKDFDIRVSSSEGVLDLPKLKTPHTIDWPDYHGEMIDLDNKRYQAREITLNCWMRARGKVDFAQKVNAFQRIFMGDGTQRLMIQIHPTKPLIYEVYNVDGIAHDKRWHDDKMIGTFPLKLKEPDPVKKVLRHQRSSAATATVSVAFKSDYMVTIYWGDGTADYDLYGDFTGSKSIKHTYAKNGIYFPIIAGIIEEITDFTTNAIIVWDMI